MALDNVVPAVNRPSLGRHTMTLPAFGSTRVALREHVTISEIFPNDLVDGTAQAATSDRIDFLVGDGSNDVVAFFPLQVATLNQWVLVGEPLEDLNNMPIAPGTGMFFDRFANSLTRLHGGCVRANDFARPVVQGNNFLAGGYPLNQSANGVNGRGMNVGANFVGNFIVTSADVFSIFEGDNTIGSNEFTGYTLLSQPLGYWALIGQPTIDLDSELLFEGCRSVFLRSVNDKPNYIMPLPWDPDKMSQ